MKKTVKYLLLLAVLAVAHAQTATEVRGSTISGAGSASGKCVVEVRVDMSAEVDVYGDSGRLRTISGQPATWTRLDCTDPLPYSITDFRFKGVDGRGNVTLAKDPRNNNSMAVIRIDDPRGGSDGYTFEIEWSGASGGSPVNGFASGWGTPAAVVTPGASATQAQSGTAGGWGAGRRGRVSAEQSLDLCRAEVHSRAERDYGLRSIDITSVSVDLGQQRRDRVTGTFNDDSGGVRRFSSYRFNCQINLASGQVDTVEFLRSDGSAVQPLSQTTTSSQSAQSGVAGYDQDRAYRACQDAVVARTNRDGYQNVAFGSTAMDARRPGWVTGILTASRGPVTDSFNFGCLMDMRAFTVRNLELSRR